MRASALIVPSVLVMFLVGGAGYGLYLQHQEVVAKENQMQYLTYENAILSAKAESLQAALNATQTQGTNATTGTFATVAFYIGTKDGTANKTLESEGFVPNCVEQCQGINYYRDPTTVVTNEGLNAVEYDIILTCGGCANSVVSYPFFEGLSSTSTGALVTDTYVGSGPCSFSNGLITNPSINTLAPQNGALVGAIASGGTLTYTVTYTWTYSIGVNTVNSGCLLLQLGSGAATGIFAEISGVGPFTLAGGDTLKEVWSVTIT